MVLRCGLQICSAQHNSCPARWSDEFAGERSCGNGSTSSERVRLLQPLLPCPQEGWWSKAHSRSQTSESRPYETAVQNDHIETDPLANMPRGLVLFAGSEWRLLSHLDNPPPQVVLEIHLRGSGLSIHGPSLWAVPSSPHFYEVHGCSSFSAETAGNPRLDLPQRLAHLGRVYISQIRAPQPHRVPRTQGQSCQERSALSLSQQVSFLGTVIDSLVTPECVLAIQQLAALFRVPRPLKLFQRMLGLMASASSALQLGLLYMQPLQYWLKPRVPPHAWCQGLLRIRVSQASIAALAPRKAVDGTGRAPGHGLQKEGCLDRRLQIRLVGTVRQQTGLRPLDKDGRLPSHQLPGNAGSMVGPSHLSARPKRTSGS